MITLKVNGRDLAPYVQLQHDAGFDPDPEYSEPQFAGAPAFAEGASFTDDATGNREWSVPLILDADDRAALHSLIRDINGDLVQGAQVEFASDSTDSSTYFDLEAGRLDVTYQYFITGVHNATRAVLKLWTRPYGHTGTARTIASLQGTGPQRINATGILGDRTAETILRIRTGSVTVTTGTGPNLMYGVKYPVPSGYEAIRQVGSWGPGVTATTFGASGRIGSQSRGFAVTPGNIELLSGLHLRPQDAGRYRMFAPIVSRIHGGSTVPKIAPRLVANASEVVASLAAVTVPTSVSTQHYKLVDLGEITIPGRASQFVDFTYVGAPGASAIATYPIRFDDLIFLPLDTSAGVLVVAGGGVYNWQRSSFEFDGPSQAVRGRDTASAPTHDQLSGKLRGDFMRLPAVGSPGASGAAEVVLWAHKQDTAVGNELIDVELHVRERFRFLR